jgi:hypothetical protein
LVAGSSASKAVAQKIEPEHQQGDRKFRKGRQVGGVEEVGTASVEHRAPARRGRLDAEAEETERRHDPERHGDNDGKGHRSGGKLERGGMRSTIIVVTG